MFLQDTIDNENGVPNELNKVETPIEWKIPDDYNFWTSEKKRQFVIDCINETTTNAY